MGEASSRTTRRLQRRIVEVHDRLRAARAELEVIEAQRSVLADDAEDASIRALVAENTAAHREAREADGHLERMAESARRCREQIAGLEALENELLGQLVI